MYRVQCVTREIYRVTLLVFIRREFKRFPSNLVNQGATTTNCCQPDVNYLKTPPSPSPQKRNYYNSRQMGHVWDEIRRGVKKSRFFSLMNRETRNPDCVRARITNSLWRRSCRRDRERYAIFVGFFSVAKQSFTTLVCINFADPALVVSPPPRVFQPRGKNCLSETEKIILFTPRGGEWPLG